MAAFIEQTCGCENKISDQTGAVLPWSWCSEHGGRVGLYGCGECGFQTRSFERLERHVYGEHLGVQVA
jgi:hypothetical protein